MNSDVSIHQKHLRFFVTEVFKSVNNLNPHFMWDYFKMNVLPYDLWKENTLMITPSFATFNSAWNKFTLIPR